MKQSLNIHKALYGKDQIQVANTYATIAQLCYTCQELRGSVENQEQALKVLQKLVPADADVLKETKAKLDLFLKLCVNQEKNKFSKLLGPGKDLLAQQQQKKTPEELQKQMVDDYVKRMQKVA